MGVGNDPRYNIGVCFDPFPFPAASDAQQQKIRELGEALDAHRKKQQVAHPGLTITGMYDEILERLVALNHERAAEEKRGLIRWLRPEFQNKSQGNDGAGDVQQEIEVADDDDEAPGEPAEKKPRRGRGAVKKSAGTVGKAPKAAKHPWPKDLAEQTRAVRAALAASGGIVTAADLARHFKNAKAPPDCRMIDRSVSRLSSE